MKNIMRASAMLIAVLSLASAPLQGQTTPGGTVKAPGVLQRMDFGVTYAPSFIKISETPGNWQLVNGISADAAYNLGSRFKHLGLAADADYESSASIKPGVNLKQFTFVAGPRYTISNKSHVSAYVETLFGVVHAFDGVYPTNQAPVSTATSFAMQLGGGVNAPITRNFGWRIAEVDYIGTRLPNNADNYQGDLRVSTGINFHF